MAMQATKGAAIQRTQPKAEPNGSGPTHEEIAALAYSLWEARGRPEGTPEEDWLAAERSLRENARMTAEYRR